MLATLVGVAAVAVFALVAYLIFKPGSGGKATNTAPSVNNSVASSSTSSTSTSTATSQNNQQQPQPQQTVTETETAQGSQGGSGGGGLSLDDVPGHISTSGQYAIGRSGSTLTVYKDTGSGAQSISTLVLKGRGGNNDLAFATYDGCSAPIIVWNSDSTYSSAAFGMDSNGAYQMFKGSSGQYDMAPDGGDGSAASSMGVHARSGYVAFNDTKNAKDRSNSNIFTGCNSDGTTLHWDRKGE